MAEPDGSSLSAGERKRTRRKASRSSESAPLESGSTSSGAPCGACKFLRRKCSRNCIFAPYFISDQGAALFAGVHKVFGASNVSKLLMQLPMEHRQHAVVTISYEAQMRLVDPVYGCVGAVIALQEQVAALQLEIAMAQNELINNRLAMANSLQGAVQPAYASSAPNSNALDLSSFDSYMRNVGELQSAVPMDLSFDQLPLTQPYCVNNVKANESVDPSAFGDPMLPMGLIP